MRIFGVAGLLAALMACTDVKSEDILTSGMYAHLSVSAPGDGTSEAVAVLRLGATSLTYVELTADDDLTCTLGEETVAMSHAELGDYHQYTADWDSANEDDAYTIALERTVDEGAPESVITLPAPFDLGALPSESISRGADDITVTWTPSAEPEPMTISVDGECVIFLQETVSGDPGTYTIPAGTIEDADETAVNCELSIRVERVRTGQVDDGYGEGGEALGIQVREGTILSTP